MSKAPLHRSKDTRRNTIVYIRVTIDTGPSPLLTRIRARDIGCGLVGLRLWSVVRGGGGTLMWEEKICYINPPAKFLNYRLTLKFINVDGQSTLILNQK